MSATCSAPMDCLNPILLNTPEFLKNEGSLQIASFPDALTAIRRFEALLEAYPDRHPFILVRLGFAYILAGSRGVAIELQEEAKKRLAEMGIVDNVLEDLIEQQNNVLHSEATEALMTDMSGSLGFFQRWRPSSSYRLPMSLAYPIGHDSAHKEWQELFPQDSKHCRGFITSLAIETNHLENTFLITENSCLDLIHRGLSEGIIEAAPTSQVQDPGLIKSILNDAIAAYDLLGDAVEDPDLITPQKVCDLHRCMMRTAGFLSIPIVPAGYSRHVTKESVTIQTQKGPIQCCPYLGVENELKRICERSADLIQDTDINPFIAASWIHFLLARCHPFNDGNGRIVRLVASIPLIRAGYPPLFIGLSKRNDYFNAINAAYNGNYNLLAQCICDSMRQGINRVKDMASLPL